MTQDEFKAIADDLARTYGSKTQDLQYKLKLSSGAESVIGRIGILAVPKSGAESGAIFSVKSDLLGTTEYYSSREIIGLVPVFDAR